MDAVIYFRITRLYQWIIWKSLGSSFAFQSTIGKIVVSDENVRKKLNYTSSGISRLFWVLPTLLNFHQSSANITLRETCYYGI